MSRHVLRQENGRVGRRFAVACLASAVLVALGTPPFARSAVASPSATATATARPAAPADGPPTTAGSKTTVAGGYEAFDAPDVVLDTAHGVGGAPAPISSGSVRRVNVDNGLLARGSAESVVVQLSVTATGRCFLDAYADDASPPADPLLYANSPTTVLDDQATIAVSQNGLFDISVTCSTSLTDGSPAGMTVRATVDGFYRSGRVSAAGALQMLPLTTVADSATGLAFGRLAPRVTRTVAIAGHGAVPGNARDVLLNVSVVTPYAWGVLTVDGQAIEFDAGHLQTSWFGSFRLNSAGGLTVVANSLGSIGVVIQVAGYVLPGVAHAPGTYRTFDGHFFIENQNDLDLRQGGVPSDATALMVYYQMDLSGTDLLTVGDVTVHGRPDRPTQGYLVVPAPSDGMLHVDAGAGVSEADLVVVGYVRQGIALVPHGSTRWSEGRAIDPSGLIVALSCTSRTFCMAIDSAGNYLTFDGAGWTGPMPSPTGLYELSCTGRRFCMAIGQDGTVYAFDGVRWTESLPGVPYDVVTGHSPRTVACSSASACVANVASVVCGYNYDDGVDYCGDAFVGTQTWNGSTWSGLVETSAENIDETTCVSATYCRGVKYPRGGGPEVATSVYDGTVWTATSEPASYAASCGVTEFCADTAVAGRLFPVPELGSFSCASTSFCYLVSMSGLGYQFDGRAWSQTAQPLASPPTNVYQPDLLSCPAVGFCVRISPGWDVQQVFVLSGP